MKNEKNRYELVKKIDSKGDVQYTAELSPKGLWIQDPVLQRYANMIAKSYRDAIETLVGQGYLITQEAVYKKDEKKSVYSSTTFYKWKDQN
ncbi:hypothetical protein [Caldiplasma sukawensis]